MVKKIAMFLLALLMLVSGAACTPQADPPPPDDETDDAQPPQSEPEPEEPGVTITAETVIVCSATYDAYVERAVTLLQYEIKQATGLSLAIVDDRTEPAEQEIVVGICGRVDAREASALVYLQENHLIFAVENTAQLYCLVRAFVEDYLSSDAAGEAGLRVTEQAIAQLAASPTAYESCVRVLTQNLRYANDADGNSVAERSARFVALIEEYAPDIVGTQEATPLWTQYLEEHFSDEYARVGVFRDGTAHAGDEANYILYRKDRFELIDSGTFWLTDDPEEIGRVEGALCNRVCTWALLYDLRADELLLACNTHLDHSNDDIRTSQIEALFAYLGGDMNKYPVFFAGDFNSLRTSEPYKKILAAGLYDGEKRAWVNDSDLDYTCHLYRGHGDTIDYCFYSKEWTPIYARIVSDDYGGYVSDHYGVIVDFVRFDS
ncbi:MAG: endonuclease/exonuclease/phosphatase family protein [Clostridia bacterium]|nr:endonuclease/exonuclease/phosphatase family protein [Clostridia bacterium]